MTDEQTLKNIVEAALLAAGRPLNIDDLLGLFADNEKPERQQVREALDALAADCESRGVEVREVASGFRLQIRADYSTWVSRLWLERPSRYSRALLETLALVAYRQPITRAEIEDIRGVSVSSSIMKTLQEREWVKVVGHRDVPGKPAIYATTKEFLNYFNLKSLDELPPLSELRDIDSINAELDLSPGGDAQAAGGDTARAVPAGSDIQAETEADIEAGNEADIEAGNEAGNEAGVRSGPVPVMVPEEEADAADPPDEPSETADRRHGNS